MRIERVDEKTVKCFLSNEELNRYEIDYKDFVMRSDKAREVVQEIMEQAREEVGFNPPRLAFDLQIMVVPDQGLVLIFSDKDPEMKSKEEINNYIDEMKKLLEDITEKHVNSQKKQTKAEEKEGSVPKPEIAVFEFASIRDLQDYAALLPANLRVDSALYELDYGYYLYLAKGHASYDRYSRACIQAMEFGTLFSAEEKAVTLLEEHGSCLIAEKALKKLRIK